RLAVENDCCPRPSDRHTLFIVAGFSAASRAELNLFDKLKALGALFLYDADPWYVYPETGRLAEAGDYLRLLIQRYPPAIPPSDTLSRPRNIHLIAVPGHSFMAYKAAQLAHQKARALIVCGSTDTLEKLSQYHDLFIPQPDLRARLLRKMDIPGFCSLALRLYNDYTSKNKKALRKDYCVALLHHPLPQQFAPAWQSLKAHWEAELKEHPYPVVTTDFLLNKVPHAQWLVEALDDPQPLGSCIKMLQSLGLANEEETLTKRTIEALTFLQDVDSSLNVEEKRLERYVQLFLQYEYGQLANEQPVLSELPVVTLLTGSRALSFETVILTDFNDGVFPDTTPQPSVIPYSLRRAFGLPTNADRVSEQMYLFYRLLHSAKDIYLLYNTQQDVDCQPVPSLVYYQLKSELNGYAFYNAAEPIVPLMIRTAPIKVTKTSEILQKIQNLLTSPQGLSPSALITYLNCPLKFYFQYIAQLREPEKAEDLGPANFGNLFHKLMEGLYNHILGQKVTKSQLEALRPLIPGLAEQVILEAETGERKAGYSKKGKWLLLRTALIQSAQSVLEYDLERCHQSFTIRYLEWDNKNAPRTIDLKANSECSFARFSGRIDRIDEIQDGYYLIDYKTGKTDKNQFDHEVAFDITIDSPNRDYSVQLYMYAWFFEPNTSEGETLSPWVYSIRSFHGTEAKQLSLEDFRKMEIGNVRPYLADFTNQVKNVTLQLLDADLPFIQTKNRKKCSYCEFNFICKR
ncbi:MAG: PD-(D/E)XK nuclease family protein, partial [Flavobacteriales bacterium]|nr:PD-(D/E)XK nuclease family protein [Flavobacteriales bacterium]MDW8411011.1 PD-(D/E)XK nuclease family protein [Flavobacteriales bacterium]